MHFHWLQGDHGDDLDKNDHEIIEWLWKWQLKNKVILESHHHNPETRLYECEPPWTGQ